MHAIELKQSSGLTDYPTALAAMEERAAAIAAGTAAEQLWLVEHPPLYTAGTSARREDLLSTAFPVYETGRGGQFTYHGPGQRVAYVMLDLHKRPQPGDVRRFVQDLEQWLILTLRPFGIEGLTREGRIGVWVVRPDGREAKIAALGIRVRRWVTFHGIAINVHPDLSHFGGIVPCGIRDFGVTSCHDLGVPIVMEELDQALIQTFEQIFGVKLLP